jgi:hypothetical protein
MGVNFEGGSVYVESETGVETLGSFFFCGGGGGGF